MKPSYQAPVGDQPTGMVTCIAGQIEPEERAK